MSRRQPLYQPDPRNRGAAGNRRRLPPPGPTGAAPGTEEKVAVMEGREAAGFALWHPLDYVPDAEGD